MEGYDIYVFSVKATCYGLPKMIFTKRIKGNLIALGTHGRKGISHLINGSLAEEIANHTDAIVWISPIRSNAMV